MHRLASLVLILMLAACQLALPGRSGGPDAAQNAAPGAITSDAIQVTSLDAATPTADPAAARPATAIPAAAALDLTGVTVPKRVDASADATADTPAALPEDTEIRPLQPLSDTPVQTDASGAAPTAADPEPVAPKSPTQLKCERKGGSYSKTGTGNSYTCITRTRDAGKQCRRESDCQGSCLARSRTCSPITPMFGCNDILQNDGQRVTLCID